MYKDFSKEDSRLVSVMSDCMRKDFSKTAGSVSSKELSDYVRDSIKNIIGIPANGTYKAGDLFKAYRRNKNTIFEIIEEVVTTTLGENLNDSPFIQQFVEVHNVGLGEREAFYSEGGLLSVASFAGNHWDTDRQLLGLGTEYTLPAEWVYIRVYEDLERFLLGITDLSKLTDKINRSMTKYINDRVYAQFQNIATVAPTEFSVTGNDEDALGGLVDLVEAATGATSVTIAGTHGALRKLANVVPDKSFAETQKTSIAGSGSLGLWEGNETLIIPQTLQPGTFKTALDNNKLFVIASGTGVKPIKLAYYGDTRSYEFTDGKPFTDQTVELQVQTKLGLGLEVSGNGEFGVFTFE